MKSKMVDGCMGAPKFFLKNSVRQDLTYCFTNFTCSYLTLHGPFPTNAPCIKINMHNWWPSWKSIWLPSPCFNIHLAALIQNINFVAEMNFLSHSLGNIGKNMFLKAAILKSKMEDGCMSASQFLLKISIPQDLLF